ncbi:hypothetical protein [Lacticaseibacillus jixiensis]|uniref:hypothetical protein n=1 Tax=Lacticaseibacillus jixiensis TaxID=3231926 RepID=UPI0036F3DC3B
MNDEWLMQEAKRQQTQATTFDQQAFYQELARFIKEQSKRIDQAQGRLDGELWDHTQW